MFSQATHPKSHLNFKFDFKRISQNSLRDNPQSYSAFDGKFEGLKFIASSSVVDMTGNTYVGKHIDYDPSNLVIIT